MVEFLNQVDIHVGSRVRSARVLLGQELHQVAAQIDISAAQLIRWEQGRERFPAACLLAIGKLLTRISQSVRCIGASNQR